jgi:glycosyltransferase involved in cell wall biosynthesis
MDSPSERPVADKDPEVAPAIDISVIVPLYNNEEHVEACIQGLLNQRYSDGSCEFILIDNNSTDKSAEIVKRYPAIRLLFQPKQGSYAARNLGLKEARGQIIAFTDSDCVPRPDWLQQIADIMRSREVGLVLGRREFQGRSRRMSSLEAYEAQKANYILSGTNREAFYGYTNNMAVRRSLIDAIGPFMELARGADTIFVRQVVDRFSCRILRFSPDVVIRHLEITSVWKWYKKMYIYGRSYQYYRRLIKARPLSNAQRWEVLKRMSSRSNFSWLECARLALVLGGAVIAWQLGRLSRLTDRTKPRA